MRVLFVTAELTPIAKVGGLGDVAGALPKALATLGVDVRVALPHYDVIDRATYAVEPIGSSTVQLPQGSEEVVVSTAVIPGSTVPVYLLHNDRYLSRDGIYFERSAFVGSFKEIERFLFFSRAALALLPTIDWWPDIIHCQDWHTGALPVFLTEFSARDERYRNIRTLFTIHNLANQGKWNAATLRAAMQRSPAEVRTLLHEHGGNLVLIEQGILNVNRITTVSPTYAQEILTPEFGEGIEHALAEHRRDLTGILNGIDVDRFNPATDPDIAVRYTSATLDDKQKNKEALLREIGLPLTNAPLVGLVSRLTNQKGIDLVAAVLDRLAGTGAQGVFLGMADPALERALTDSAEQYPKNFYTKIGFDAVFAQKIYAGADIFLMPSLFEPCGLGQMIAMRYGTIPVVRATGGLKDTVRDGETGFVFTDYSAEALWRAIERTLATYRDNARWHAMQLAAMSQDFSWSRSAKEYVRLYERLIHAAK